MLINFNLLFKIRTNLCFCRLLSNETAPKIKYTNTINLPKTKFPARLNVTQRLATEKTIILVIIWNCGKHLYHYFNT